MTEPPAPRSAPAPPARRRRAAAALARALRRLVLLTLPSLLLLALALELACRLLLPVSDYPATEFHPGLGNHFRPGQEGVYAKGARAAIRARYRINAQGWNATRDFAAARARGLFRVAVIGDSFVEALQVPPEEAFPARLERLLPPPPGSDRVEVLALGHSGASLAQYVQVVRREACRYAPDLVLLVVVFNDFVESLEGRGRADVWSLRREGERFLDVPPRPAGNRELKLLLRRSALARYLVMNLDALARVDLVRRLFYGDARRFEANVDPGGLSVFAADPGLLPAMLRHLLARARQEAAACGARLGLVLDANRHALYEGSDPRRAGVAPLMAEACAAARALDIPVLDLTDAFAADWAQARERFEWPNDGHWSPRGHRVVAEAVAAWLRSWTDASGAAALSCAD